MMIYLKQDNKKLEFVFQVDILNESTQNIMNIELHAIHTYSAIIMCQAVQQTSHPNHLEQS